MIPTIENKLIELAKDAGIYNEGFAALDTEAKVLGIQVIAHISGETEVEQMCQKMKAYLS